MKGDQPSEVDRAPKARYYRRTIGTPAGHMYYRQRAGEPFERWHARSRGWTNSTASDIADLREMWTGKVEEITAAELPAGVSR
jgi:hypothetical protein